MYFKCWEYFIIPSTYNTNISVKIWPQFALVILTGLAIYRYISEKYSFRAIIRLKLEETLTLGQQKVWRKCVRRLSAGDTDG